MIVFWILFALVVAIAAGGRGRSVFGWFLIACVISPLLAAILLALLPVVRRSPISVNAGGQIVVAYGGEQITFPNLRARPARRKGLLVIAVLLWAAFVALVYTFS